MLFLALATHSVLAGLSLAIDDEVHALAAATAKGVEISRILLEYDQGELW